MSVFSQVVTNLQRAKDNYGASLRSIDSELRKIVSQDPSQLAGARAIQASYGDGFAGIGLSAAEQPEAPAEAVDVVEEPKAAATTAPVADKPKRRKTDGEPKPKKAKK